MPTSDNIEALFRYLTGGVQTDETPDHHTPDEPTPDDSRDESPQGGGGVGVEVEAPPEGDEAQSDESEGAISLLQPAVAEDETDDDDSDDDSDPEDDDTAVAGGQDGAGEAGVGGGAAVDGIDDSISERNSRIDEYSGPYQHQEIRQRLRESGVAKRIQQELSDLFSGRDHRQRPDINTERQGVGPVGGKYEMRAVVRRTAGDLRVRNIFSQPQPGQDNDVAVCCIIDLSGSMDGEPEQKVKEAAGAFLFGVQQFGGTVTALGYPAGPSGVELITGPHEPFRWRHLDAASTGGGTPTSEGIEAGVSLLEPVSADKYLCIVLTDGSPRSINQTKEVVDDVRERSDWDLVGFGYGRVNEGLLERQFGERGARCVDLEELPGELVSAYEEQTKRSA